MDDSITWPLSQNIIRRGLTNHTFGMVRKRADGTAKPHQGWDFAAEVGTPFYAVSDGIVRFVRNRGDYGMQLCLEFQLGGETYFAFYAHLQKVHVERVRRSAWRLPKTRCWEKRAVRATPKAWPWLINTCTLRSERSSRLAWACKIESARLSCLANAPSNKPLQVDSHMRFEFAFIPSIRWPLVMGSALCALSLHVGAAQPSRTEKISIKGKACDGVFPLADGRRFAACGKSLYIAPSKGSAEQASPVGRLHDDTVWAVRELPLSPAVPLGADTLTSLVLVDTGNELCYGTMVMGLLSSGDIKQWGTVDQVLEREENVECISSAVKLNNAAGTVSLTLPADHSRPTPDGAYKRVHQALVLPVVRAGQFCQKGKTVCGKGLGK